MITKILPKRANPRPLLAYLDGKGDPSRRLLDTNLESRTPAAMAKEISSFSRSCRPELRKLSKHMILSFAPEERLSDVDLQDIARFYLERMGYGEAPYAVFLHTDTGHPHLHIVTTPTSWDGTRIRESRDWPRSERVARQIERRWGLREVASSERGKQRAPTDRERHAEVRKGEISQREAFQLAVSAAARSARTLPEFLSELTRQGFEVRLALDGRGALRGIAFSRGGAHFRGAQLGRAFTGSSLLTAFGLDYEPARDLAAIQVFSNPTAGRVTLMAVAESRTDDSRQERREPAPSRPKLVSKPLPEGRYQLAGIDPTRVKPHPTRIPQEAVAWRRQGWSNEQIEEARNWLARENHSHMLLVRPEAATETHLAFRGVSKDQLADLKTGGFEPAWVVQVGDRYDVLFRAHQRLSQPDASALAGDIAARFDLAVSGGYYRDAVRLPGSAVHLPEGRELARLVEVRERPFSESEVVMEELRRLPEQRELARLAAEMPPGLPRDPTPAMVAEERLAARPSLPFESPIARLQAEVEMARDLRSPGPLSSRPLEELFAGAREANRQAVAAVESSRSSTEALESHPAVRELLSFEAELARRRGALEEQLGRVEPPLRARLEAVENLALEVEARPDLESIRRYQEAVQVYVDAQADHQAVERAYSQVLSFQAALDRERLGAAVVAAPRDPEVRELHRLATVRELDLARQWGAAVELSVRPDASPGEIRRTMADQARNEPVLLSRLRKEGAAALPDWERHARESVLARAQLERAEAQRSSEPRRVEAAVERGAEPRKILQEMVEHQRSLAERARAERGVGVELIDPRDRLRQAAARVGSGDCSPEALRRLNAELVRQVPREAITPPLSHQPRDPRQVVERYLDVRRELVQLARSAAQPGPMDAAGQGLLLARSTEALGLHQQVQRMQRDLLGILDPGKAPQGLSQGAWELAWLQRATEKGLLLGEAQAQLGNLAKMPAAAGRLAAGRALWLGSLGVRAMASKLENYAHRVLTQG